MNKRKKKTSEMKIWVLSKDLTEIRWYTLSQKWEECQIEKWKMVKILEKQCKDQEVVTQKVFI